MDRTNKEHLRRSFIRDFKERVVISAGDEREVFIEDMAKKIYLFLLLDVATSDKYGQTISDTISDSVEYMDPWDPGNAASAFRCLMKYVLNVLDQPYKRTFHTIKIYSGYFYLKVMKHLKDPERILSALGYQLHESGILQLSPRELISVDKQVILACECLIASVECSIMSKIWDTVQSLGYGMKHVLLSRETNPGSPEDCAKWIRINIPKSSILVPAKPDGGSNRVELHRDRVDRSNQDPPKGADRGSSSPLYRANQYADTLDIVDGPPVGREAPVKRGLRVTATSQFSNLDDIRPPQLPKHTRNSPPGDILEGTREEHMRNASQLLSLPVRNSSASSPTSDRFDQKVWESKPMEEDTILRKAENQNVHALGRRFDKMASTGDTSQNIAKHGRQKTWSSQLTHNEPIGTVFDAGSSDMPDEPSDNLYSNQVRMPIESAPPYTVTLATTRYTDVPLRVSRRSQENLGAGASPVSAIGQADVSGTERGSARYATGTSSKDRQSEKNFGSTDLSKSVEQTSTSHGLKKPPPGRPPSDYMHGSSLLGKTSSGTLSMKTTPITRSQQSSSRDSYRAVKTEKITHQPASLPTLRPRKDEVSWICEHCTTENVPDVLICSVCSKTRIAYSSKIEDKTGFKKPGITCPSCTYRNKKGAKKCDVCQKDLPSSK